MYNKIFAKILDSSIWLEPDATRIVWLTCIAAMDEDGFVQFASVTNLARRANVSLKAALAAVARLESPDPESSDPDHDGRRLERVQGGWLVLNAAKYRELVTRAVSREQTRQRVQRFRARRKRESNASVTPSEAVSEAVSDSLQTIAPSVDERPLQAATTRGVDEAIGRRAAAFLETYADLYRQHRHGAKLFRQRPAVDWDRACNLCRTWDDARLEKMAVILLTTDDDWIAGTDRGFGVFVARATWCDERLSAWEAKRKATV